MPYPSADLSLVILVHVLQDYLHTHIKSRKVSASTVLADFSAKLASYEKTFHYPQKHKTPDASALAQVVTKSSLKKIITFGKNNRRIWEFAASQDQIQAVLASVAVDSAVSMGGALLEEAKSLKDEHNSIRVGTDEADENTRNDVEPLEREEVPGEDSAETAHPADNESSLSGKNPSEEESSLKDEADSGSEPEMEDAQSELKENSEGDTTSEESTTADKRENIIESGKDSESIIPGADEEEEEEEEEEKEDDEDEDEDENVSEADAESEESEKEQEKQGASVDGVVDDDVDISKKEDGDDMDVEIEEDAEEDEEEENEDNEEEANEEESNEEMSAENEDEMSELHGTTDISAQGDTSGPTKSATQEPSADAEPASISGEEEVAQDQIEEQEDADEQEISEDNDENQEEEDQEEAEEDANVSEDDKNLESPARTEELHTANSDIAEESTETQSFKTEADQTQTTSEPQDANPSNHEDGSAAGSEQNSSEEVDADDEDGDESDDGTQFANTVEEPSVQAPAQDSDINTEVSENSISEKTLVEEAQNDPSESKTEQPAHGNVADSHKSEQTKASADANKTGSENASIAGTGDEETPGAESLTESAGRHKRKLDEDETESEPAAKKPKSARSTPVPGRKKNTASDSEDKASLTAAQKYKKFQAIAVNLVKSIEAHRFSSPFLSAVTAPQYRRVVKSPKDLKAIMKAVKRKQHTAVYSSVKELKRDIFLMLTNCVMFNKSSAPLVQMAREMKEDATKMFKMFEEAEKLLNQ